MIARRPLALYLTASICFLFNAAAQAELVKRSSSGLCHPPESAWYERTNNFTKFDSLRACLRAGGRLPRGISRLGQVDAESKLSNDRAYKRSAFGHGWDDADEDCQDSRAEALIAQSTTQVRFSDERRCRVVTGRWISPFTGNVIQNSSEIDIDHVVPLKWAWDHGANTWSTAKRERFANDPVNLWSVELTLNRQKGAKGPEDWLPPSGRCQYVSRFVRIVKVYRLKPSEGQFNRYKRQLSKYCG